MQPQQSRDEKTVAIATGLGLFCLVLAAGGLVLWGIDVGFGLNGASSEALGWVLVGAAAVTLVAYLGRGARR